MLAHPPLETASLLEVTPCPWQMGLPLGKGQEQKILFVAVSCTGQVGSGFSPHSAVSLSPGHAGGSEHAGRAHGHRGSPPHSSPGHALWDCPGGGHGLCTDVRAAGRGVLPAIHPAGRLSTPFPAASSIPGEHRKGANNHTLVVFWEKSCSGMYRFFLPRNVSAFQALAVTSMLYKTSFRTSSNHS